MSGSGARQERRRAARRQHRSDEGSRVDLFAAVSTVINIATVDDVQFDDIEASLQVAVAALPADSLARTLKLVALMSRMFAIRLPDADCEEVRNSLAADFAIALGP